MTTSRAEQQAAYDANKAKEGGQAALAPQANPGSTTSGTGALEPVSTPAMGPVSDTSGADGAGSSDSQYSRDLLDAGDTPDKVANQGMDTLNQIETSVSNVGNGNTSASGAIGDNTGGEDPEAAAANIGDQKLKLQELLTDQGGNPETALKSLRDDNLARYKTLEKEGVITQEYHTKLKDRWKNIFNVIPKEDFGMVLMDFGMRAMMAGETMGNMGALGAAGSGALAGVAQRKEQGYQRGIEQEKMAGQEARADMNTITAAETAGKKGADTVNTDKGIMKWNPKTQAYDTPVLNPDGTTAKPSSLTGRPSTKDWEIKQWMSAYPDMSEQEATARALTGITPEQANSDAEKLFSGEFKAGVVFVPGKGRVTARNVSEADKKAYIDEKVRNASPSRGGVLRGGDDGGAALGGDSGDYEWKMTKPASWTGEQGKIDWDNYVKDRKAAIGR